MLINTICFCSSLLHTESTPTYSKEGAGSSSPVSFASDVSVQAPVLLRARDPTNDSEIRQIVATFVEDEPRESEEEYTPGKYQLVSDDEDDEPYDNPPYLVSPIRTHTDAGRRSLDRKEEGIIVADRRTQVSFSSESNVNTPTQENPMDLSKPEDTTDARLNDEDIASPEYEEHLPEQLFNVDRLPRQLFNEERLPQQLFNETTRNRHRRQSMKLQVRMELQNTEPVDMFPPTETHEQVTCSEEDLIKTSFASTNRLSAVCDQMITSTISTGDSPDPVRLPDEYEFPKQNPQRISGRRQTTYVSGHFQRESPS